jgi:hypothetical protein
VAAGLPSEALEVTADEDFAVMLERKRGDLPTRAGIEIIFP